MRGARRRDPKKQTEATARAEVSAWLEEVGTQLDDQLLANSVESGMRLYQTTDLTIVEVKRPSADLRVNESR